MDYLFLFLTGIIGGVFAGMLGIGGGIIYVAILPYAFRKIGLGSDVMVAAVVANSILATFFAATFALFRQRAQKNIYVRQSLYLGIPGGIVVITAYKLLVESGGFSFLYFNVLIIAVLLFMLVRHFLKSQSGEVKEEKLGIGHNILIGSSGGLLSALSGLGGGAIVVPLLLSISKMDIKKATSVSMGFIFFTSFFMSLYNFLFSGLEIPGSVNGVIVLPVVLPLIAGVIIGAPLGVRIASRISSRLLTILFIIFIIAVMFTRIRELI
jgi:hypothetical protein